MKRLEATITLEYADEKIAKAVANALSPDNFKTPPKLTVETVVEHKKVVTQVKCGGKLLTFTGTLDDILSSVNTAEKALKAVKKI